MVPFFHSAGIVVFQDFQDKSRSDFDQFHKFKPEVEQLTRDKVDFLWGKS